MKLYGPLSFPSIRAGTIIRPMSRFGSYWQQSVSFSDAAYVVRDDLIFTACHFDQDAHEGEFYTEHDEPTPEEVRLLSSLALAIGYDWGFMAQYPDQSAFRVADQLDLCSELELASLEHSVRQGLVDYPNKRADTDPPLPPGSYSYRHDALPSEIQARIFGAISDRDHLLIRGLATWLKASMLHVHSAFAEEANYALYISLDASLSIILNRLRSTGRSNPSTHDAQEFVHAAFGEQSTGSRYFEDFYQDRIMTLHPDNRFGIFVFAPTGHDDFYWLHNGLREVYRYLMLGELVDPQEKPDTT